MTINIAVFAHNEEANIERCLGSIREATSQPECLSVKVLVNGSTDRTPDIVSEFCQSYSEFELVNIPVGCKSNAWNTYVYSGIDFSENHYFLDGDNWLSAGALDYVEREFDSSLHSGCACTPMGISESLREFMIEHKFISGNFYGLSGNFLATVVQEGFKLPIGYIGDDSLVQYLLQEGISTSSQVKSILVIPWMGAVVPRPRINAGTVVFLHKRYKRYALRHFQQEVFYYLARNKRLDELPADVSDIAPFVRSIGLKLIFRWCGVQTFYHPWAYLKLRSGK